MGAKYPLWDLITTNGMNLQPLGWTDVAPPCHATNARSVLFACMFFLSSLGLVYYHLLSSGFFGTLVFVEYGLYIDWFGCDSPHGLFKKHFNHLRQDGLGLSKSHSNTVACYTNMATTSCHPRRVPCAYHGFSRPMLSIAL